MKLNSRFVVLILYYCVTLTLQDNPEGDQVLQLISSAGFQGEAHYTETDDGYELKIHRIVPKIHNGREPVILMHGLLATAADFLITGPDIAIAYLLSNNGYDVYLGNSRGNKYSTKHRIYTTDSTEYWRYSWHEIGYFDLAAITDYVLKKTTAQKLDFIAFSQGTTSLLVLLSSRPEYNSKIRQAHLMAPPAFRKKLPKSQVVFSVLKFLDRHNDEIRFWDLKRLFRIGKNISKTICRDNDLLSFRLCKFLILSVFSTDNRRELEIETKVLPHLINYMSPRVSVMQLTHYYQNMIANKFRQFDYKDKNFQHYNSTTPPDYNLSKITAPVYLYHAGNDRFISEEGVAYLRSLLPNVQEYRVISNWSHIDFVYSKYSRDVLYNNILHALLAVSY
ncbi:hypothetical protein PVAND_004540 [Polypedilum vanderplanki]|uniref:Lipase n=1 Tax=Polypedilum vanderplanki TaxID=319348 RepID=A0A9J6BXW3_POLVA|nr:hypothetical protein PVAND_004540 [Polypedilum vanderplanki]